MTRRGFTIALAGVAMCVMVEHASAQTAAEVPAPHPTGRVSFYSNLAQTDVDGLPSMHFGELTTSVMLQAPADLADDGLDYGVDARESGYTGTTRSRRVSIYEGFVGVRLGQGTIRARVGHLWLTDLGSLGSLAGAMFEYRQPKESTSPLGRMRVAAFAGLEPNIADTGYAADVRKYGAYVAFDGDRARRHVVGFVTIRNASLTERSVLSTTNFLPVGRAFFLYQAAEYDLQAPSGQGRSGLTYFFTNARISPASRLDLQLTYNRGRSVDTRGLAQDVASGRPLTQISIDGLLYQSAGGRATVEVVRRVRVYAGYSRDKTNRDDAPTGRTTIGGYAGNVLNSGIDLAASDSTLDGSNRRYHSRYASIGRPIGRAVYVSGDYSTSLSIIRFSRSDGILIEQRPETKRLSATATINVNRAISLMTTVDRTMDQTSRDFRVLSGITYRFQ